MNDFELKELLDFVEKLTKSVIEFYPDLDEYSAENLFHNSNDFDNFLSIISDNHLDQILLKDKLKPLRHDFNYYLNLYNTTFY